MTSPGDSSGKGASPRGLDDATFLIIIVTPSWFRSPACRDEFEQFLEIEKRRGRDDLILPVLYIDAPVLRDEKLRVADPIATDLASRQYFPFADLRFEPWTSADVGKRIASMATAIRDALLRDAPLLHSTPPAALSPADSGAIVARIESAEQAARSTSAVTPIKIRTVDLFPGLGDHTSIAEAIQAAALGDRILVRPGLYRETLVLYKTLEILGDGPRDHIIIESSGDGGLGFSTTYGRVVNLTLRQSGGGSVSVVTIAQGRLDLEDCALSNSYGNGVYVASGADPILRRNRIYHCSKNGVLIGSHAKAMLEDNEIVDNGRCGITVMVHAEPVLRRNRIQRNRNCGIFINSAGGGTFEENDLRDNQGGPWNRSAGAEPRVKRRANLE